MSSNSPLSERMRDLQSNLAKNKTVEDIVVLLASNWKVFNSENLNPFVTASKVSIIEKLDATIENNQFSGRRNNGYLIHSW